MKHIIVVLFGIIFLLLIPLISSSNQNEKYQEWQEYRITTEKADQNSPRIYDDKIVWTDNRNGNWDIYLFNISNGKETQITKNASWQASPDIFQNIIVWSDNRTGNYDIYMFDLDTKEEIQITKNSSIQQFPKIYKNIIIWCNNNNDARDIYSYNLENKKMKTISKSHKTSSYGYGIDIYEDKIVWQDNRSDTWNIYLYNLSNENEIQITHNSAWQLSPVIYDNIIVWDDERNSPEPTGTVDYFNDLYFYDLKKKRKNFLIQPRMINFLETYIRIKLYGWMVEAVGAIFTCTTLKQIRKYRYIMLEISKLFLPFTTIK